MAKTTQPADPIGSAVGASRTHRMTRHEVAWMVACCVRIHSVYLVARQHLDVSLFEYEEAPYVLLWRALCLAADDNRGCPPADPLVGREIIAMKCSVVIASDPARTYYTAAVEHAALSPGGLVDEVYKLPISDEVTGQGMLRLSQFVTERMLSDPLRRAMAGVGPGETLSDPMAVVRMMEDNAAKLADLGTDPGSDAVSSEEDFRIPPPKLFATGMPWLDHVLNGGQARQEAYALLGPSSGGKTAMAVQLAVEGAERETIMAAQGGPDAGGHWYYFSYELNVENQLRPRVYQYGARLHANTIQHNEPYSSSEVAGGLKPYESDSYVNSPGNPVMGEKERIAAFRKRMTGVDCRLHLVDYSGRHPGHGVGGIDEILAYLQRQASRGRKPAGFVIDYAGLCVNRMMAAKRMPANDAYQHLVSFIDLVRSKICVPLDCAGWVLHQLHGDAAKRPAGGRVHHSDALGCRNFADNADFGLQITKYNDATGMLAFFATKHRRAPGCNEPMLLQFRREYGAFIQPNGAYEIDPQTHQIVPAGFMDMVAPGPVRRGGASPSKPAVDPLSDIY